MPPWSARRRSAPPEEQQQLINDMVDIADSGSVDLVVKQTQNGIERGFAVRYSIAVIVVVADVEYWISVTDTETGNICGLGDTDAL